MREFPSRSPLLIVAAFAALVLAACVASHPERAPIPPEVLDQIAAIGSTPSAPIYIRIFKEESELEVWKQRTDGYYALLVTYDICAWSGALGPKLVQGDRQAPEGFYRVTPAQMNPDSSYHLSFDLGFPNAFDAALGRTGSYLMVHGACSSAGCYAVTDGQIEVIYALAREAFRGGQRAFDVHAFPFRMTPENMAVHRDDPNLPFWEMLKVGYDHFEVTRIVPSVEVCDLRYVFNADAGNAAFIPSEACPAYAVPPAIATAVAARQAADHAAFEVAVAQLEAGAAGAPLPATPVPVTAYAPVEPPIATPIAPIDPGFFERLLGIAR